MPRASLLLEGWGITETSGGFTLNPSPTYRFGTVGTAFAGHELRLMRMARFWCAGPASSPATTTTPQATAEVFTAGAGSTPATSARWTATASCASWTARKT